MNVYAIFCGGFINSFVLKIKQGAVISLDKIVVATIKMFDSAKKKIQLG